MRNTCQVNTERSQKLPIRFNRDLFNTLRFLLLLLLDSMPTGSWSGFRNWWKRDTLTWNYKKCIACFRFLITCFWRFHEAVHVRNSAETVMHVHNRFWRARVRTKADFNGAKSYRLSKLLAQILFKDMSCSFRRNIFIRKGEGKGELRLTDINPPL